MGSDGEVGSSSLSAFDCDFELGPGRDFGLYLDIASDKDIGDKDACSLH